MQWAPTINTSTEPCWRFYVRGLGTFEKLRLSKNPTTLAALSSSSRLLCSLLRSISQTLDPSITVTSASDPVS